MVKYYAGIGSRETPTDIFKLMTEIASILEVNNFILRSGAATGADAAFESGISDFKNMNLFLPKPVFNDHNWYDKGCIYINDTHPNYQAAYDSIIIHPAGFKLSLGPRNMMIRNYFQVMGINDEPISSFVICWTPDGADGITKLTSRETGGTGQAIRIACKYNVPVYNLNDYRYKDITASELVDLVLSNLGNNINPNSPAKKTITTSLF